MGLWGLGCTPTRRPRRGAASVSSLCSAWLPRARSRLCSTGSSFALDAGFIAFGASGFTLMALGLLASLPVVLSIGRNPDSRLYPRSRGALAGWGVSLYLLGMTLVIQIGAIAANW